MKGEEKKQRMFRRDNVPVEKVWAVIKEAKVAGYTLFKFEELVPPAAGMQYFANVTAVRGDFPPQ